MDQTPVADLFALLDLDTRRAHVAGTEPVTTSPHRLAECMAAAMAAHGIAAARFGELRGAPGRSVRVSTDDALLQLMGAFGTRVGGVPATSLWEDPNLLGDSAFYRCRDGREIFLLLSYPHLRDRALRVLGCPPDRAAITEAVSHWDSEDLEAAIVGANGTAATVRTTGEWAASEAGRAVAGTPVVELTRSGDAPSRPRSPLDPTDPPLKGIRVLDLTHVIAGPVAARLAAEYGAEVLHVSRPDLPDPNVMIIETGRGKRNAFCDLRSDEGRAAFAAVLDDADVLIHSYRNLAQFGLTSERLATDHPGLILAEAHGWGADGPWGGRGGFDQLACAATGFALEEGGGDHAALPPTYLLNDYVAAFLLSAGVEVALARQLSEGGSWRVRANLARVCTWVQSFGRNPQQQTSPGPDLMRRLDGVGRVCEQGPFGQVERLPSLVETTPDWLHTPIPSAPLGSSPLAWTP